MSIDFRKPQLTPFQILFQISNHLACTLDTAAYPEDRTNIAIVCDHVGKETIGPQGTAMMNGIRFIACQDCLYHLEESMPKDLPL